jgi:hypothetical protein
MEGNMIKDAFIDEDVAAKALAMLKTMGDNKKVPGVVKIMSGLVEQYSGNYNTYGVQEQRRYIPDNILRDIERKNPIISACVNLRCRQIRSFSKKSDHESKPGFKVKYIGNSKVNSKIESEISILEKFFMNAGLNALEDMETGDDNLHDVLIMLVRDYMILDKIALELMYSKRGLVIDFRVIDPATIKIVLPSGFLGNSQDIDNRNIIYFNDEFMKRLASKKMEMLPDLDKIRYVQQIDGEYVAGFTGKDIIYDIMNKRSDVRYRYTAYSPVEQAVSCVIGFLNALAYNAEAFNSSAIPKIGLSFEQGDFSQEELERIQDQWIANYRGIKGSWRIPLFNGKVNVIDLMRSPRDMEYGKYIEITGALVCSVMGVDPAEIGLRLNQAQNVLSENLEAKMKFSKDRGLHDLLGQLQNVMNKILIRSGLGEKYMFEFTGLDPEDEEMRSRLRTEAVKRDKTVNEIRAEQKLPPLEYGDVILDSIYMQYYNIKQQEKMQQQQGGEGGDITDKYEIEDDLSDEAIDEVSDEVVDKVPDEALEGQNEVKKARTILI